MVLKYQEVPEITQNLQILKLQWIWEMFRDLAKNTYKAVVVISLSEKDPV